jgi:hypothetical protein
MYEDPKGPLRWYSGRMSDRKVLLTALENRDIKSWNRWRRENPGIRPNLRGIVLQARFLASINLRDAFLTKSDLRRADLEGADLRGARLAGADVSLANLAAAKCEGADFSGASLDNTTLYKARLQGARFLSYDGFSASLQAADLYGAVLQDARLYGANLEGANLTYANLDGADLRNANLDGAIFSATSIRGAKLSGASVDGVVARYVRADENTDQRNLRARFNVWITRPGWLRAKEQVVGDLRVASFLGDLESHAAVSHLVTAGSASVVLILGRFTAGRRRVLRHIEEALRRRGKIPKVFDFPGPKKHEFTDTVRFIASMSEFIIADLTNPRSVPLELQAIVPDLMVPVVPIVEAGKPIFSMFGDLRRKYFWVLQPVSYRSGRELVLHFDEEVIGPVEAMKAEIRERRVEHGLRVRRLGRRKQGKRRNAARSRAKRTGLRRV